VQAEKSKRARISSQFASYLYEKSVFNQHIGELLDLIFKGFYNHDHDELFGGAS
jgi:hypothetical protein